MTETNNRTSMGWVGGGSSSKQVEPVEDNKETNVNTEDNVNTEQEESE